MGNHEVGPVALGDVEQLRAHLDPGRRYGEGSQLEFLKLLQIFDDRDRLAARRVVIKKVGYLLAFETTAQPVLDELDRTGTLRPIGRRDWEEVGKALAVGRGGNAETGRSARDLVLSEFLVQRLHLRRAIGHDR